MWNLFKSNKQYVLDHYPEAYAYMYYYGVYIIYSNKKDRVIIGRGKGKSKAWKDAKNYIKHYQEESIKSQIRKIGSIN